MCNKIKTNRENVFPENVVSKMIKYFGRKKELNLLEEKYLSDKFEFGYLYGQRRIGKTTLLEMFKENKKVENGTEIITIYSFCFRFVIVKCFCKW